MGNNEKIIFFSENILKILEKSIDYRKKIDAMRSKSWEKL
jgi:hypothetical protein